MTAAPRFRPVNGNVAVELLDEFVFDVGEFDVEALVDGVALGVALFDGLPPLLLGEVPLLLGVGDVPEASTTMVPFMNGCTMQ